MGRLPFESEEACLLNKQIFETIYYGALEASCELAEVDGPYSTYEGSPVSQGKLQYDMWGVTPTNLHDWAAIKAKIAKHGIRNSLLWRRCPPPAPPRSSATMRAWRLTPQTSTADEASLESSKWSISICFVISLSLTSGPRSSRTRSSLPTAVCRTSPRFQRTSKPCTRPSGRSLRRLC